MKKIKITELKEGDYIYDREALNGLLSGKFLRMSEYHELHYKPDKNDTTWENTLSSGIARLSSYDNDDYWNILKQEITILDENDIDLINLKS